MVLDAPNRRVNDAAAILDACYDLIAVVDDAGEIRSINSATKHLFGKEPTAFIGLKATDLVHPDDLASVAIAFDRLARRVGFSALTCRFAHQDGTWVTLELTGSFRFEDPAIKGLVVSGRPVATRHETALDTSEADLLYTLLHLANEAMMAVGETGEITVLNHSMRLLMGMQTHEQADLRWPDWFALSHVDTGRPLEAADHPLTRSLAGVAIDRAEFLATRRDGSVRRVVLRALPRPANSSHGAVLIFDDVTKARADAAEIERVAFHDQLTGLPNRRLFAERLEAALARARSEHELLVVLACGLDRFSVFDQGNDQGAGDQVLLDFGAIVSTLAGPNGTPCRLGSDEFGLLCTVNHLNEALDLGERLALGLYSNAPNRPSLTTSVGLVVAEPDSTPDQLTRDAQSALHEAKHNGRGRLELFQPALRQRAINRASTLAWLRSALVTNGFELHFQPIIESSSGTVSAAEALIRGRSANGELLMPSDFLPVAYRMGLALEVDSWVLDNALDAAARWYSTFGAAAPAVSINLSSQQLARPDLAQDVLGRLQKRNLPPGLLWLEVTETGIAGAHERGVRALHELRGEGIELAIDDFGTGASSLGRLRDLPFTLLKVDRSFVAHLPGLLRDESIVRAIGEMAEALGMEIIAEGVEHTNQLGALNRAGCTWLQGFLFSKPLPESELVLRLQNPDPAWAWALGLR